MAIKDAIIAELKFEGASTKKMLERVPMDQKDWKPNEKSMSVGRLATHIAQTINWASEIANRDEFDFMTDYKFSRESAKDSAELLSSFDKFFDDAIADVSKLS